MGVLKYMHLVILHLNLRYCGGLEVLFATFLRKQFMFYDLIDNHELLLRDSPSDTRKCVVFFRHNRVK